MKALTITQPWASLIAFGQKLVENRSWNPPRAMIGQRFAIHASRECSLETLQDLYDGEFGYDRSKFPYAKGRDFPLSAIIGVATLARFVRDDQRFAAADSIGTLPDDQLRWFMGPVGFVLEDVQQLTPIAIKGALSFWQVPDDVEQAIAEQLKRAVAA